MSRDTPIQSRASRSKTIKASLNENDMNVNYCFLDEMRFSYSRRLVSWPRVVHIRIITHIHTPSQILFLTKAQQYLIPPKTHNPNPPKLHVHHLLARSQPVEMEANLPNSSPPSSSTPHQQYLLHQTNQVEERNVEFEASRFR
jgi:hypothetical protein